MLAHSRVMIHDPLIGGNGIRGSAVYLDAQVKDTYFYAEEAIEFGLADKIITQL